MSNLRKEFEFYLENQADLVEKYDGKFIVIKDSAVIGVYADEMRAVAETRKTHAMGTFLVQKVELGDAAYTQTFHSRASFA